MTSFYQSSQNPEKIWQKLRHFCLYQERSMKEVEQKLKSLTPDKKMQELIIEQVESMGLVNDERFAFAYVSGKFHVKGWGPIKIRQQLKLKGISDFLLNKALDQIPTHHFEERLQQLAEKKAEALQETDAKKRFEKLGRYLLGKGYPMDKVMQAIKSIEQKA